VDYRVGADIYPSEYIPERAGRHRYGPWYTDALDMQRRTRYVSTGRVLLMKGKRYLVYRMTGDSAALPYIFFEGQARFVHEQ
jgi:hypothetical protein